MIELMVLVDMASSDYRWSGPLVGFDRAHDGVQMYAVGCILEGQFNLVREEDVVQIVTEPEWEALCCVQHKLDLQDYPGSVRSLLLEIRAETASEA